MLTKGSKITNVFSLALRDVFFPSGIVAMIHSATMAQHESLKQQDHQDPVYVVWKLAAIWQSPFEVYATLSQDLSFLWRLLRDL